MATSKKSTSKINEDEAKVNFRYGLSIMKQNGDTAGLAKAKKANPALYADWEKRQAGIKKTGKK
jgi:hypothetical protein